MTHYVASSDAQRDCAQDACPGRGSWSDASASRPFEPYDNTQRFTIAPHGGGSDSAVLAVPGVQSKPQLHVTHIHGHTWAQRLDHTGPLSTSGGPERGSEATCPFLDRFSGRPVQILAGLASVNCLNSRWKRCLLFLASDFRQTCRHRRFT